MENINFSSALMNGKESYFYKKAVWLKFIR